MYVILYERTLREPWRGAEGGERRGPPPPRVASFDLPPRRGSPRPAAVCRTRRACPVPRYANAFPSVENHPSRDIHRCFAADVGSASDTTACGERASLQRDAVIITSVLILLVESVFTPFSLSRGGATLRPIQNTLPCRLRNSRPPQGRL